MGINRKRTRCSGQSIGSNTGRNKDKVMNTCVESYMARIEPWALFEPRTLKHVNRPNKPSPSAKHNTYTLLLSPSCLHPAISITGHFDHPRGTHDQNS